MTQTYNQIEQEAHRRVAEDGTARLIYQTIGAIYKITFFADIIDLPPTDIVLCIIWPDRKVELLKGRI